MHALDVIVRLTEIIFIVGIPRCTFLGHSSWADAPPSVQKTSFQVSKLPVLIGVGEAVF